MRKNETVHGEGARFEVAHWDHGAVGRGKDSLPRPLQFGGRLLSEHFRLCVRVTHNA